METIMKRMIKKIYIKYEVLDKLTFDAEFRI